MVAQHESNTTLSTKSIIAHKLNLYTSLAERRFCVPRAPPLRSTPRRRPRRVARRVRVPRGLKRRRLKALEQRVARHRNELSSDASLAHSKRGRWWNVHRPPHLMLEVRLRHEADACEAVPRVEPPSGGDTRFKQARPLSTYTLLLCATQGNATRRRFESCSAHSGVDSRGTPITVSISPARTLSSPDDSATKSHSAMASPTTGATDSR